MSKCGFEGTEKVRYNSMSYMPCVDLRNQRCKSLNRITVRCTRAGCFTMKRLKEASKYISEVNTDAHLKCFLKKFALSIS